MYVGHLRAWSVHMTVFPHGTDGWGSKCELEGLVTTACRSPCLRRCLGDSDLCKSPFLPLRQSSAFTLSGRGSTCIRSPIFSEMVSAKLYKQKDTMHILDVCSCTHTETHREQMLISCSGHVVHVCTCTQACIYVCVCMRGRGVCLCLTMTTSCRVSYLCGRGWMVSLPFTGTTFQ